jgi:hypothetical protein
MRVDCRDCLPIDTLVNLSEKMTLPVSRDAAPYGHVHFRLIRNEVPLPNTPLCVAGRDVTADAEGIVELDIPLEEQAMAYPVTAAFPLSADSINAPCGPDDVLTAK